MTVWAVAFYQLFVGDLGNILSAQVPEANWILRYRFLVLVGLGAIAWLVLGTKRLVLFGGYVGAFPLIVLLWEVPKLLFRNWPVLVVFAPAVQSIVVTFKVNFVLFSAALISAFVVALSPIPFARVACMAFLGLYLVRHFGRRFRAAFSPSTVFGDVSGVIRTTWAAIQQADWATKPVGLDPESVQYKEKLGQNLLTIYAMSTALYSLADRVRAVVRSRRLDLYFVASLLYTFVLTTIVFAVAFLGLESLRPGSFAGTLGRPSLVQFLSFSFGTLMTSGYSSVRPVSGSAQLAANLELVGSLLIIVLLVFVVLTSIRERYREDLDEIVSELGTVSGGLSQLIEANYETTLAGAEAALFNANPVIVKWCLKLRHGETRAKEIEASLRRG